jgi:hypothetical protein
MGRKNPPGQDADEEPAWSFDSQGDYAVSRSDRIQRIVAVAIVLLWVGMVFYSGGLGYALRSAAFYLIPLACIWRPDVLAEVGMRVSPLTTIDERTSERVVRICGWLWLFFPLWVMLSARFFSGLFQSSLA